MSVWRRLLTRFRKAPGKHTDDNGPISDRDARLQEWAAKYLPESGSKSDAAAGAANPNRSSQPGSSTQDVLRTPKFPEGTTSPYRLVYTSRVTGRDRVLPFVIGVVGDFSGRGDATVDDTSTPFIDIDRDSFDAVMRRIAPRLDLTLPDTTTGTGKLVVPLIFTSLADFDYEHIARVAAALIGSAEDLDEDEADRRDRRVSRLAADMIEHPDFARMSRAWYSLHHLVGHTSTGPLLRVRVMDYSRQQMARDLQVVPTPEDPRLPRILRILRQEYARPDGEPFALLVVDGVFDRTLHDVDLLDSLAMVGDAGCVHVLTAAAPEEGRPHLLAPGLDVSAITPGGDSSAAVDVQQDSEVVQRWRALRESYYARALVVATLVPAPESSLRRGTPQASYVVAERVAAVFARDEWPGNLTGGLSTWSSVKVRDALFADYPDYPWVRIAKAGLTSVLWHPSDETFSLFYPQSLHKPDVDSSTHPLSRTVRCIWASLPPLLAAYRVMHYLQMQYVSLTANASAETDLDALHDRVEKGLKKWVQDHWQAKSPKPFFECPVHLGKAPGGGRYLVAHLRPEANGPVEDTMRFIASFAHDPVHDSSQRP